MASTYNKLIQVINMAAYDVLEVTKDGESIFYIAREFEPPSSSAVGNNPYFYVKGFDFTELFKQNASTDANNTLQIIRTKMSEMKPLEHQYASSYLWAFYKGI